VDRGVRVEDAGDESRARLVRLISAPDINWASPGPLEAYLVGEGFRALVAALSVEKHFLGLRQWL
jgi:hypothetical protein